MNGCRFRIAFIIIEQFTLIHKCIFHLYSQMHIVKLMVYITYSIEVWFSCVNVRACVRARACVSACADILQDRHTAGYAGFEYVRPCLVMRVRVRAYHDNKSRLILQSAAQGARAPMTQILIISQRAQRTTYLFCANAIASISARRVYMGTPHRADNAGDGRSKDDTIAIETGTTPFLRVRRAKQDLPALASQPAVRYGEVESAGSVVLL